jgi:DNA polymerase-1
VKTLLVDGDNLFKIGFHGVKDLFVEGNHIGGVFHFLNTLRRQLEQNEYDKIIVFWDGVENSIQRRELYPQYKMNRRNDMNEAKLESYYSQKKRTKEYLEECFVRQVEVRQNESDDLIAYYCSRASDEEKIVFSSDKDLLQLVDETTSVFSPIKREMYNFGDKVKMGDFYIPHDNVLTTKILMGDKSDNIDGIKLLGEKTFVKFFPEVLDMKLSVDDILTKTKELVKENKDIVLRNILSGVTKNGELGEEFYVTNQTIVDLKNPLISEEAKQIVEQYYSETLDPEGRGFRNIIVMMTEDGFFKYLPKDDEAFVDFLKPFMKLTRKEKRKFNQQNQTQL